MIRTLSFSFQLAVVMMTSFHVLAVHAGQPRTVVLDVRGMTCGTCPITGTTVQVLTQATSDAGYPSTVRSVRKKK